MTRRDYIRIAEALRFARGDAIAGRNCYDTGERTPIQIELSGVMTAAKYIANALQGDNSRFDRSHFLAVVRGEKDLSSHPVRHCAGKGC